MLNNERAHKRRERGKAAKLGRLERAARELFHERGYDETTTRAIAQRAGVGVGTVFLYFPEKRDLLQRVMNDDLVRVSELAVASVPEAPLVRQLEHVFGALFDFYASDMRLARGFVREQLFLDERQRVDAVGVVLGFLMKLAGLVEHAKRSGTVGAHVEPMQAAYGAFALYHLALTGWLGGGIPSREALDSQLRASLALQFRGLAALSPNASQPEQVRR